MWILAAFICPYNVDEMKRKSRLRAIIVVMRERRKLFSVKEINLRSVKGKSSLVSKLQSPQDI